MVVGVKVVQLVLPVAVAVCHTCVHSRQLDARTAVTDAFASSWQRMDTFSAQVTVQQQWPLGGGGICKPVGLDTKIC